MTKLDTFSTVKNIYTMPQFSGACNGKHLVYFILGISNSTYLEGKGLEGIRYF